MESAHSGDRRNAGSSLITMAEETRLIFRRSASFCRLSLDPTGTSPLCHNFGEGFKAVYAQPAYTSKLAGKCVPDPVVSLRIVDERDIIPSFTPIGLFGLMFFNESRNRFGERMSSVRKQLGN